MNRRSLLLCAASVALAGCVSFDIKIELPHIQDIAGRFTAWIVSKFSWAPDVIKPVQDKNAAIQKLTPAAGWGPLLRMALSDFVGIARAALKIVSLVAPIPAAYMNLANNILGALETWLAGGSLVGAFAGATAMDRPLSLDDADNALLMLEQSQ